MMTATPFVTSKLERAKAFLQDALADGPRPAINLAEEAAAHGLSASTLARARVALKVTSQRDRQSGAYFWRLRRLPRASAQAPFQLVTPQERDRAGSRQSWRA